MPVAYLVSQYPAVNHTFILREIRELRRIGFDIRVASVRAADRPYEALTPEEQEEQRAAFYIKPVGLAGALAANLRILFSRPIAYASALAYAVRLAKLNPRPALSNIFYLVEAAVFADWMRRHRIEHVHIHFSSTVGLLARRILPMQMSATIHGPDEFQDPAGFYLRQKIAAFDMLVAISDYGRGQLMRFSESSQWDKLHVVRLGVDPVAYSPRPFRYNPAPFEILCVGRLAPVKGQRVLIAAMDRLLKQGRSVRLRLVGDGPDRESIEQEIVRRGLEGHVIVEGRLNADRVRALYDQTDIFALASFAEGIPVVLMEAMAMEIACVATLITGIPELIRQEVDGLLVRPSSDEELAIAIARLLDDSALRARLGTSARQRVLEHYDLARNVQQLAELLRKN